LNSNTKHPESTNNTTTFYITNFPDDISASDIWTSFDRYWRVGEVYIPAKIDRLGKRFGFARFVDVTDAQSLLEKIEGSWFGTFKIRANISRFNIGVVGEVKHDKPICCDEVVKGQGPNEGVASDPSFKRVLLEGGKKSDVVCSTALQHTINNQINPNITVNDSIVEMEAVPCNLQKLKHCFVGFLKDEVQPDKFHMLLAMEGLHHILAAPLGVDVFLLSSSQQQGVKKSLEENREWWKQWFVEIKAWNPLLVPTGRRIWVRIHGVPPQAWGVNCFNKIIQPFGKIMKLDSQTQNQTHLDVARVLITQNSWVSIDCVQEIKISRVRSLVRLVEEGIGDVDLRLNRKGSPHTTDDISSWSSVKGWRRDDGGSDHGWKVGCSDEDSGEEENVGPPGIT
jgi:hypothetical protein